MPVGPLAGGAFDDLGIKHEDYGEGFVAIYDGVVYRYSPALGRLEATWLNGRAAAEIPAYTPDAAALAVISLVTARMIVPRREKTLAEAITRLREYEERYGYGGI